MKKSRKQRKKIKLKQMSAAVTMAALDLGVTRATNVVEVVVAPEVDVEKTKPRGMNRTMTHYDDAGFCLSEMSQETALPMRAEISVSRPTEPLDHPIKYRDPDTGIVKTVPAKAPGIWQRFKNFFSDTFGTQNRI